MSLLRSHIYKFIVGVLIIFIISPIPALFITHKYSYITGFISIFHNFAQLSSMTIPKIDWMHESIFFSANQMVHTANQSTPLFPYMWKYIFIDCSFYLYSCNRILHQLRDWPFIFKAPQSVKKFTSLLRWIPYSLCTVLLQCAVLLLLLYITKFIKIPYYSSFIIVCSTSMIIVMQAIKNGFLS